MTAQSKSPAFVPRAGAVRIFTCTACALVLREEWTGSGRGDFKAPAFDGCQRHKTHPGRGPHAFTVEVQS